MTLELIISSLRITLEITPDLSVEHGRFSILENRTWPMFDFRASNMANFRFWNVERGPFSIFGHRTWPNVDFRVSNMAYFRFSAIEHGLFSILKAYIGCGRLWTSAPDQSGDAGISATLKLDQSGNFG